VLLKKAEKRFKLTTADYARLAAFRYALRGFLRFSETAAAGAGLTAQHYQAMLILRACPEDERVTINDLAQQLLIKHNSAVGLVDRLVQEKLAERRPSSEDRRKVELALTARGRQVLAKLAAMHRRELQRVGPVLEQFFAELSNAKPAAPAKKKRSGGG
jgi:DNA-binding MarR family transcriptional regulator